MKDTITSYLRALEAGDYPGILACFDDDAVVHSPLYGEMPAAAFYRALFDDTDHSIITPLRIFTDNAQRAGAAYFQYEWVLDNGRHVAFSAVDLFEFSAKGKIVSLTIIYDTAQTRPAFEALHKK